jgi:hypothetical protein
MRTAASSRWSYWISGNIHTYRSGVVGRRQSRALSAVATTGHESTYIRDLISQIYQEAI